MVTAGQAIGGRYRLIDTVASGGMAQVWHARDEVLGRPVAVKVLHPHLAGDHAFLLRFRREAVAAARLSHPGIVAIYDTVSGEGGAELGAVEAIVMELVDGRTLREELDANAPLSAEHVADLGLAVADALASAHRAGVVHRDIKPSNILLLGDAGLIDTVKVTDFGIAKAGEDTDLTVTGTLLGTAKYLSPEQVRGDAADPRSDLYSLGVVLFEAATGSPPFLADTDAATALARLHGPAPRVQSMAAVPEPLALVIDRLLALDPGDRFETAAALRLALLATQSSPAGSDATTTLDATALDVAGFGVSTPAGTRMPSGPTRPPTGADAVEPHGAFPGLGPDEAESPSPAKDYPASGRSVVLPALVVILLGAALVVAALLISDSSRPDRDSSLSPLDSFAFGDDSPTTALTDIEEVVPPVIAALAAFDPEGDGTENDARLDAAVDGDSDTVWPTDTYKRDQFAGLKSGVGIIVTLEGLSEVSSVELTSPSSRWTAEIFVGEGDNPAAGGTRGDAVGVLSVGEADGVAAVDLLRTGADGQEHAPIGTWVLVWLTDPGTSPPTAADIARTRAEESAADGPLDAPVDPSEVPPAHRFELAELTIS